jgi:hypothetical protein
MRKFEFVVNLKAAKQKEAALIASFRSVSTAYARTMKGINWSRHSRLP